MSAGVGFYNSLKKKGNFVLYRFHMKIDKKVTFRFPLLPLLGTVPECIHVGFLFQYCLNYRIVVKQQINTVKNTLLVSVALYYAMETVFDTDQTAWFLLKL